jgi:3-hydroxyacyl-[acyl-carrier protein] dehydratase/trans-2-decenoyl-[acyl-carrier protein] isomerase
MQIPQVSAYSRQDVLAMGEGGFFGKGNAQLPNSYMLMIDEIPRIASEGGRHGKGLLEAKLKIEPGHWFFDCHFKGDPVMPGCLGLDALWQLLGVFLGWSGLPGKGRALGVGKVKFSGQIYPDAGSIDYRLDIKRIFTRPMPMGIADGVVVHGGRVIYEASDLKVGLIKQ